MADALSDEGAQLVHIIKEAQITVGYPGMM